MSLSKRINTAKCRHCFICLSKNYTSQSTDASKHLFNRMAGSQASMKTMTANHWKLISHLREQFTKPNDKNGLMFVINKEWANLLKKLPSIAGQVPHEPKQTFVATSLPRHGENRTSIVRSTTNSANGIVPETSYGIGPLINDIKSKLSQKSDPNTSEDEKIKWKTKKVAVSNSVIAARTKYVLYAVTNASTDASKLKRLEDFVEHMLQYPESVNIAVMEGAIKVLLTLRQQTVDHDILAVVGEALTILGYLNPLTHRGVRILSIDGGGIRGLLVIEMLKKLEELTGTKVCDMFDYICGVSTGSVITCCVGTSNKSLDELSELYMLLSTKIFTQNAFYGTKSLLWSHSYYDTSMWEELLQEHVGHTKMIKTSRNPKCPKIGAISTVSVHGKVSAFIFRNYAMPFRIRSQYMGSYNYELWEAARASAAAPSYFEEFRLGDMLHQDGGVLVNNPTAVAIHEAKQLWPGCPIQCVVSFGTGRIHPVINSSDEQEISKATSWKEKFYQILDSATDTEGVHTMLNDLLPETVYYRFNPYLTEMLSMVEYQPEKLSILQQDAAMYIRRNEEKFRDAANALMTPRTYTQHWGDWFAVKSRTLINKTNI